jgi:peroxiredoxin Q/BCP
MVRTTRRAVAGLLLAGLFAAAAPAADDPTKLKVKEGDAFPDVPLKAAQVEKIPGKKAGDTLSIADLKGKTVVVFFYPRALTGGCTKESCGFRDLLTQFPKDAVVLGASNDDEKLQQKFIDVNKLTYPLLCDTDFKLINALGISAGKAAKRVTFVVDKDGKIAKIYGTVNPTAHPDEVLKFVAAQK